MKSTIIKSLLLCTVLVFFGCNKNSNTSDSKISSDLQKSTSKQQSVQTTTSVIIYDGTPFYSENSEGKMVYANEGLIGEEIRVFMSNNSIEQKNAIRLLKSGEEEEFNFIHVLYSDTEYWTRDIFITNNAQLTAGLITEDAIVYSSADSTAATERKLEQGTILAINESGKVSDPDLGIEFIPVTYYNGAAFGKEVFVKASLVSSNKENILALNTINKLMNYEQIKPEVAETIINSLRDLSLSFFIDEKIDEVAANLNL